jgi:anti-sigma factor RsiW
VTCREFTERLADHLDDALPHRSDRAVRRHASRCRACRAYQAQYRATIEAVRTLAEGDDLESEDVLDVPRLLAAAVAGQVH